MPSRFYTMNERGLADRRFWVCSSVIFLDETLYVALVPLLPLFATLFDLSSTTVGILVAGYPLVFFLSALPAGLIVDRSGVRLVLLVGTALLVASTVLFAIAESAAIVLAARCMQGLASGITSIAGMVAIAQLGPRTKRGATIGTASALTGLSGFAGPILGGYLTPLFGIRLAFAVPALFGCVAFVMVFASSWTKPVNIERRSLPMGPNLRDPLLVAGLLCMSTDAFVSGAVTTLVPLRLAQQGLSIQGIGSVMLIGAVFGLVSVMVVGRMVDRKGATLTCALWASLLLIMLAGLGVSSSLLATAILFALVIPFLRAGGTLAYILSSLSRSAQSSIGTNFGVMMSAWALGATIGPLFAGSGADLAGFVATMVVLGGITAVLGGFMLAAIRRSAPHV